MKCVFLLVLAPAALMAQRPLNLDFEKAAVTGTDRPWGWTLGWTPFTAGSPATFLLDTTTVHHGKRSLKISLSPQAVPGPQSLVLQVPSKEFSGRTVELSAWMRSSGVKRRAFLSLEAWGNQVVTIGDTARVTGDTEWARQQLEITMDSRSHSLVIVAAVDGPGTAWFDHLELTVDGKPIESLITGTAPTPAQAKALAARTSPLRSFKAREVGRTGGDDDLALFDRISANAHVIGLGESTHGTSEFFQVKHRLLEHLVRTRGFSVFAIEANQLAVEQLNRYVQGGPGTAQDAMRVMFAVWNRQEMEALVEWLRTWNAQHTSAPVRFLGYDMQDNRVPFDSLRAFLSRREPSLVSMVDDYVGDYRAMPTWSTPQLADTTRTRWRESAEEILREVTEHREGWLGDSRSRVDSMQVEWAVQAANLLLQATRGNETLNVPDRDSLMAANLDWALKTIAPGAKAVVWAHDIHVAHGGDKEKSFFNGATMGAELKRRLGPKYQAFSLLTYEGEYSATKSFTDYTLVDAEAFPGPEGSMEQALHELPRDGAIGLIMDLSPAVGAVGAVDWLSSPRRIRHVGFAAYDYAFEMEALFPLEFDGIIFIDKTTPSTLLRKK
ncbi:MAG TPA: erythromycin esterase family protein [Gemmatimonadales bacterium]|nr:erythromycin esterase family protein [Gemmatimonadales bacterium]